MTDYYAILGVPRTASAHEIRAAYVRLARERHPDLFRDPKEKEKAQTFFQDLTTAYNTLYNENRRREYDQEHDRPKPKTPDEIAQDAFDRASGLAEQGGSLDEVLTLLRTAVHHRPAEGRYHAALGRLLGKRTTYAREAIQCLEKASQLTPDNAVYHADLALLLLKQGLKVRAQKAIAIAVKLAPYDPQIQKVAALIQNA
jgi:curved DNA-binding protein CbpA